jgi:endonuclease YncB( thermonuclease family)
VNCIPISLDQYGRTVASCSVGETDLAEWLVGNGKFDAIQRKAEHEGRGMWSDSYVEPWLIESASEPVGGQLIAPTTRMLIPSGG